MLIEDNERDYLERRMADERRFAEDAASDHARKVHLKLAGWFEQRLAALGGSAGAPSSLA